jgi:hypothetical protein
VSPLAVSIRKVAQAVDAFHRSAEITFTTASGFLASMSGPGFSLGWRGRQAKSTGMAEMVVRRASVRSPFDGGQLA